MNNNMTTEKPMSNEEVIEILKGIVFGGFDRTTRKERQALDLAIKSLEERPQGEWLFTEIDENYHVYGQCSICKERNRIGKACRSCGARMEVQEHEK